MQIRQLFDADSFTYTYLIWDEATMEAAIIDPVDIQVDRDLKQVEELGLKLLYVLDTHVHADHITSSAVIRQRVGSKTVASTSGAVCADVKMKHGDVVRVGSIEIKALETPGHTDDSLSFVVPGYVFTGDALFVRGTGRTDFQNGNAKQLYHSITGVLFELPENTVVLPGHDYRGLTVSSIGEEKRFNPRAGGGRTEEEFVAILNGLNLPEPKHLRRAVPANRVCGDPALVPPTLCESAAKLPNGTKAITLDEFTSGRTFERVVDVREADEFAEGHIKGAELVPLNQIQKAALKWNPKDPIVLVCRSGNRSGNAATYLASLGFECPINLQGGMMAWQAAGLEIVR